jgi:DNA-binding GntR family transcriptional regulator
MSWPSRAERIDHSAPKLLWEQVADDIRADIRSGDLPPGARLPAEVELAEIYGVARVTIRRAVLELRKEGQLIVIQGRGTFVPPKS